jgi:SAM-dependent methyltransferase
MSIDRQNRIAFEEVADLYNEVRPGYPERLVDDILALSGIRPGSRILEVGTGPGNATALFARRGFQMLGIELGERLAALARHNSVSYPNVEIRQGAFEDCDLEDAVFDLGISADAFHWIPPDLGYPKLARILKPSGSAALFWCLSIDPHTDWSMAIEEVYRLTARGIQIPGHGFTPEQLEAIIRENFANSGGFREMTMRRYPVALDLDIERYLKLLRTFSSHRHLDERTRSALYWGIRSVLEAYGGRVLLPQMILLFHAFKRG